MATMLALVGLILILVILRDAFETIVLPRRVTRQWRLTNLFYKITWWPWRQLGRRLKTGNFKETFLSFYGPLSLLFLIAVWAIGLVVGFALLEWGLGLPLKVESNPTDLNLGTYLYMSGVTFFTLGFGDVTPHDSPGRLITVAQAGIGFGFLGLIIGYLPTIYSAFSQREADVTKMDARAGSPPSSVEILRRHALYNGLGKLSDLLDDWEDWSAQILESHLSYPLVCYFRSQHENESWVAALSCILDTCALVMAGLEGVPDWSAHMTFAMARHAAVDLTQSFQRRPTPCDYDRLPPSDLARLRSILVDAGIPLRDDPDADRKLHELRELYEPYIVALSAYLLMDLPPWLPPTHVQENWQSTAWQRSNQPNLF